LGRYVTVAAPAGLQARVLASGDFNSWQLLWSQRFDESPIDFLDATALVDFRAYRLLLGVP
jgi:hypothetical protein